MIKKTHLLQVSFFLFFIYALELRWTLLDNQSFAKLSSDTSYGGELVSKSIGTIMLLIFALPFMNRIQTMVKLIPVTFWLAIIIPTLSLLWTINEARTISALILLAITVFYSVNIVIHIGPKASIRLYYKFAVVLIFISAVLALAGDSHVLMSSTHIGKWRGLFNHKNVFGPFLATIFILTIFGGEYLAIPKKFKLAISILILTSLFMTGSSTSIALLAVGLVTYYLNSVSIRSKFMRAFLYVLAIAGAYIAVAYTLDNLTKLTELLDRDVTLTGRTELWRAVLPFVFQKPFGFGFGTSGGEAIIDAMRYSSGWAIAKSTHNVYLTRALDVGLFGMVLMVVWVARYTYVLKVDGSFQSRSLLSSLCVMYLVGGITEVAGIFYTNSLTILIMMLIASIRMDELRIRPFLLPPELIQKQT